MGLFIGALDDALGEAWQDGRLHSSPTFTLRRWQPRRTEKAASRAMSRAGGCEGVSGRDSGRSGRALTAELAGENARLPRGARGRVVRTPRPFGGRAAHRARACARNAARAPSSQRASGCGLTESAPRRLRSVPGKGGFKPRVAGGGRSAQLRSAASLCASRSPRRVIPARRAGSEISPREVLCGRLQHSRQVVASAAASA